MMIDMAIVVLFAIMLFAAGVEVFSDVPRDMCDVFCFFVISAVGVAVVLVSIVRGA